MKFLVSDPQPGNEATQLKGARIVTVGGGAVPGRVHVRI